MDTEPNTPAAVCPPHHWMIDEDDMGRQRWACCKCGLVRQEERRATEVYRLANVSTWGRDEIALVDLERL